MRCLMVLLCLGLLACDGKPKIQRAPVAGDVIQLPAIEWHVVTQSQLEQVYREAGMPLTQEQQLQGFVGTRGNRTVLYTLAPQRVDDQAVLTLGHEVLHAAIGDYHP